MLHFQENKVLLDFHIFSVNVKADMTLMITRNGVMLPYAGAFDGMSDEQLYGMGINLCQAGGFGYVYKYSFEFQL